MAVVLDWFEEPKGRAVTRLRYDVGVPSLSRSPDDRDSSPGSIPAPASRSHAGAVAGIILIVALAAAISVDVVRTAYGVKGDEATYVMMALSAAYDGDLSFEQHDLERFWGLYRT